MLQRGFIGRCNRGISFLGPKAGKAIFDIPGETADLVFGGSDCAYGYCWHANWGNCSGSHGLRHIQCPPDLCDLHNAGELSPWTSTATVQAVMRWNELARLYTKVDKSWQRRVCSRSVRTVSCHLSISTRNLNLVTKKRGFSLSSSWSLKIWSLQVRSSDGQLCSG